MKRIATLSALPALMLIAACSPEPVRSAADEAKPAAEVTVSDAWCRPSPNGAQAGACYVTLISEADDKLMGGKTPRASELQVHEMKAEDGVMKMNQILTGMDLKQGQAVMLAPGGAHLMLMGLTAPLVAGETVPLTLEFAAAPAVTVEAVVRQPGARGVEHGGH
nr:copper chaperone PCu(A)C [uncultured Brevundimonas sp.]